MIKAFDKNVVENRNETLRLQKFYMQLHPADDVYDKRPDIQDLETACNPDTNNWPIGCGMISAAVKARVGNSIMSIACDQSHEPAQNSSVQTFKANQ